MLQSSPPRAKMVRKKQRGMMLPLAAIDAVEAATKLPFEEGCKVELKLFTECLFSPQSKALIHVFFGEREVAKAPDIPKDTPLIPVKTAAPLTVVTLLNLPWRGECLK
jgi:3-hydroxyacyl-CoA dehydrogenase